jgi:hypothetical protein
LATRTLIEYVDDLDGSPGAETIRFSLDGTAYEIDLNGVHAKKFRKTVKPYAAVGRPVREKKPGRRTMASRERGSQVRRWAKENGYKVGEMGRIPYEVQDAFNAALGNTRTLA